MFLLSTNQDELWFLENEKIFLTCAQFLANLRRGVPRTCNCAKIVLYSVCVLWRAPVVVNNILRVNYTRNIKKCLILSHYSSCARCKILYVFFFLLLHSLLSTQNVSQHHSIADKFVQSLSGNNILSVTALFAR